MIEAEKFIAEQQYKKYGRITPCGECRNYKPRSGTNGYGVCAIFGRMMKETEFCCYGKEKLVDDVPLIPKDAGERKYSGLTDE